MNYLKRLLVLSAALAVVGLQAPRKKKSKKPVPTEVVDDGHFLDAEFVEPSDVLRWQMSLQDPLNSLFFALAFPDHRNALFDRQPKADLDFLMSRLKASRGRRGRAVEPSEVAAAFKEERTERWIGMLQELIELLQEYKGFFKEEPVRDLINGIVKNFREIAANCRTQFRLAADKSHFKEISRCFALLEMSDHPKHRELFDRLNTWLARVNADCLEQQKDFGIWGRCPGFYFIENIAARLSSDALVLTAGDGAFGLPKNLLVGAGIDDSVEALFRNCLFVITPIFASSMNGGVAANSVRMQETKRIYEDFARIIRGEVLLRCHPRHPSVAPFLLRFDEFIHSLESRDVSLGKRYDLDILGEGLVFVASDHTPLALSLLLSLDEVFKDSPRPHVLGDVDPLALRTTINEVKKVFLGRGGRLVFESRPCVVVEVPTVDDAVKHAVFLARRERLLAGRRRTRAESARKLAASEVRAFVEEEVDLVPEECRALEGQFYDAKAKDDAKRLFQEILRLFEVELAKTPGDRMTPQRRGLWEWVADISSLGHPLGLLSVEEMQELMRSRGGDVFVAAVAKCRQPDSFK